MSAPAMKQPGFAEMSTAAFASGLARTLSITCEDVDADAEGCKDSSNHNLWHRELLITGVHTSHQLLCNHHQVLCIHPCHRMEWY